MASDDSDPKVKDMLDAATLASLERWFGLPSYTELAEKGAPPPEEDPAIAEVRERREKAIAAVDPAFVEAHQRRMERAYSLIKFSVTIELRVDPTLGMLDHALYENRMMIAEPREIEIPEPLRDDLNEVSPQAILRDLYRPETFFDKVFEVVDILAEQRLDAVTAVAEVMSTNWKLGFDALPLQEARAAWAAARAERKLSITHLLPGLPNRTVTE